MSATCPWDRPLTQPCDKHGGPMSECHIPEADDLVPGSLAASVGAIRATEALLGALLAVAKAADRTGEALHLTEITTDLQDDPLRKFTQTEAWHTMNNALVALATAHPGWREWTL